MLVFSLLACSAPSGPWAGSWSFDTQESAQELVLDGVFEVLLASEAELQGDHLTRTYPRGSPENPSGVVGLLYGLFTGEQWQLDLREDTVLANSESAWGQDWVVMELEQEGPYWFGNYRYCMSMDGACEVIESGELWVLRVD